jgi:hypothetical protein
MVGGFRATGRRMTAGRRRVVGSAVAGLALLAATASLQAQSATGALFLLLPTGARAVGLGEAVVADTLGSESLWWNAAGLARLTKTEVGVQGSRTLFFTGSAVTYARPSARLGTIAVGVNLLDAGSQELTNSQGVALGEIALRNWIVAASYATTLGRRVDVGLTYKFFQTRFDCSGFCQDVPVFRAGTSAVDLGLRAVLPTSTPIAIGASVRNIGPRFQINDREQADPIATAFQTGVTAEVPAVHRRSPDLQLRVSSDLFYALRGGDGAVAVRAGTELQWRGRVFVRGGWVVQSGDGSGPSIGFGARVERLIFDIGSRFDGLSAATGQLPTYVSLRFGF